MSKISPLAVCRPWCCGPYQEAMPTWADAHAGRFARSVQVGIASWYGPQHQGRQTASGEIFDMRKLTAAHPTLPLASKVRVTNLENGKSVEVKINDRGPYVRGRIIDVSEKAARRLGMKEQGLARVRVEPTNG